jgi:hypothetical protein
MDVPAADRMMLRIRVRGSRVGAKQTIQRRTFAADSLQMQQINNYEFSFWLWPGATAMFLNPREWLSHRLQDGTRATRVADP